jgi:hypothetical protein
MIYLPKPGQCDPETLHAQIANLGFGPCCIEWLETELGFSFDRDLDLHELDILFDLVAAHDGSAAIAAREEREAQVRAIKESSAPLAESAREKRLRGEALTQSELAALMDFALFGA